MLSIEIKGELGDLITFNEEILNGTLLFLCSDSTTETSLCKEILKRTSLQCLYPPYKRDPLTQKFTVRTFGK